MQFSIVALIATLAAVASASTIRDLPTSATYYVADIDQTCTFAKDQKIKCTKGHVGNAENLPAEVKDAIILNVNRLPEVVNAAANEDPNGPSNFACLGLSW